MGFVVPIFAAFVVLAAVPVLVHLYGRPRAERRPFAAIRFLIESDRKSATRRRLRRVALLSARALAIAAVPLLLAKPYLETRSSLGVSIGESEAAVIVLDDSRSMGDRSGSSTRFALAQARARRLVASLGSDSEAAVLLTSIGAAAPQAELTADRRRLTQAIDETTLGLRPGDTSAALRRAAAILAAPATAAPHKARRVYLVSDLAAHGFSGGPAWGEGGPDLLPIDVGGDAGRAAPQSRAVVDVRAAPAPQLGPRGIEVVATLANFGSSDEKDLSVTLRIDGRAVAKGLIDVPARGRVGKHFLHVLAGAGDEAGRSARAHEAVVEIAPDGLASDDRRFLAIEERRSLRVLLVDGDPRTVRHEDEVFFLETALRPGDRGDSHIAVRVVTVDQLGREGLEGEDVIFAANLKAPDADTAARLAAFVSGGGGLFLSVGDNVDCDAWNERFGDLLPQPLATVRTVAQTARSRNDGEAVIGGAAGPVDGGERIARLDRLHPLLAPFGSDADGGATSPTRGPLGALRESRVARYVILRPTPRAAGDDARRALLRLDSGAPLLVEGRKGAGRVLLLTTTVDRDWADLAIQPAYLPLIQQAARYLARAPLDAPAASSLLGQPRELQLAEGDTRADVELPGGDHVTFGQEDIGGRRTVSFTRTELPGVYQVAAGDSPDLAPLPGASFAVNVDPIESDLARVDPAVLAALAHPSRGGRGGPGSHRTELWHELGALLLVLLLAESALSLRR